MFVLLYENVTSFKKLEIHKIFWTFIFEICKETDRQADRQTDKQTDKPVGFYSLIAPTERPQFGMPPSFDRCTPPGRRSIRISY